MDYIDYRDERVESARAAQPDDGYVRAVVSLGWGVEGIPDDPEGWVNARLRALFAGQDQDVDWEIVYVEIAP